LRFCYSNLFIGLKQGRPCEANLGQVAEEESDSARVRDLYTTAMKKRRALGLSCPMNHCLHLIPIDAKPPISLDLDRSALNQFLAFCRAHHNDTCPFVWRRGDWVNLRESEARESAAPTVPDWWQGIIDNNASSAQVLGAPPPMSISSDARIIDPEEKQSDIISCMHSSRSTSASAASSRRSSQARSVQFQLDLNPAPPSSGQSASAQSASSHQPNPSAANAAQSASAQSASSSANSAASAPSSSRRGQRASAASSNPPSSAAQSAQARSVASASQSVSAQPAQAQPARQSVPAASADADGNSQAPALPPCQFPYEFRRPMLERQWENSETLVRCNDQRRPVMNHWTCVCTHYMLWGGTSGTPKPWFCPSQTQGCPHRRYLGDPDPPDFVEHFNTRYREEADGHEGRAVAAMQYPLNQITVPPQSAASSAAANAAQSQAPASSQASSQPGAADSSSSRSHSQRQSSVAHNAQSRNQRQRGDQPPVSRRNGAQPPNQQQHHPQQPYQPGVSDRHNRRNNLPPEPEHKQAPRMPERPRHIGPPLPTSAHRDTIAAETQRIASYPTSSAQPQLHSLGLGRSATHADLRVPDDNIYAGSLLTIPNSAQTPLFTTVVGAGTISTGLALSSIAMTTDPTDGSFTSLQIQNLLNINNKSAAVSLEGLFHSQSVLALCTCICLLSLSFQLSVTLCPSTEYK
jgi:hypothetical protein